MNRQHSLQRDLSIWIIATSILFGGVGAVTVSIVSYFEAQEIQDDALRQIAQLVEAGGGLGLAALSLSADSDEEEEDDDFDELILIRRVGEAGFPQLPGQLKKGFQTVIMADSEWRVFYTGAQNNNPGFVVLQQTEVRNEVALMSSVSALLPMIAVVVAMLVVIHWIIRTRFKPLMRIGAQVQNQDAQTIRMLPTDNIPTEVAPFLMSINTLLQRIDQTLHRQRRFIADASHELRTPVAALRLLVDSTARASTDDIRRERHKLVEEGVERLSTLTNQLLDLARLQNDQYLPSEIVRLDEIVSQVVGEMHSMAECRNIDVGVKRSEQVQIIDKGSQLAQLVRNAIDNAIRYSQSGSSVDISTYTEDGKAVFLVEDSGVGIPADELGKIMRPFHRSERTGNEPGNGLGLAISQEISQQLGGKIAIRNRDEGGVEFRYTQPLSD